MVSKTASPVPPGLACSNCQLGFGPKLVSSGLSGLACPGSQHGFGPNLGFMFGMPGLSTWLWCERRFQVWHARALNRFGMPLLPTGLWPEAGFQVWHARAPNMALARTWVSCLACPGSQQGFGPEAGFQVWHARALNMALARTWVSSLACPGFEHQHGFGANAGFKFGMPGLSTGLACPGSQQGFGPKQGFKFGMPGLSTSTWLWCERRFQVWHARVPNRALARSRVSSLACPGSQQGFGPKPDFKFGMPGLPTWLWPELGFHVWHARALNRALARSRISSLAWPGSQHGFGPNLGFKFGMPGLSWLWCERRFQVWHARALNRFGMPGLPTGLWPEPGFHVWHARALNRALARSRISCLACPGSQQGFGPKPDFKFGMSGLSTWLWPELGFQVWHARAFNINMALVRTQVSSLACPGSQHGFGPNLGFKFGMPGL